ncbi:MAG TPA: hypothetical protein VEA69_13305 [Tepidisphaeraceae bacterium]|nr:hypothetical protein [Tepidisphaeraceae bacterium]
MGTVFSQIADHALYPCGGDTCNHCGRSGVPIYVYTGEIVHSELAADPEDAEADPEVYEVCARCILGGNLVKSSVSVKEVARSLAPNGRVRDHLIAEYHRMPDIPLFVQWDDWPHCCGEWCEFQGVPASYDESKRVPADDAYWDRGPKPWSYGAALMPESLQEVSRFRCQTCGKRYFTWQST